MKFSEHPGRDFAAVALAAWMAWVLFRYQHVQAPEPLATLLLEGIWLAVWTAACLGAGGAAWRAVTGDAPDGAGEWIAATLLGSGALAAVAALLAVGGLLRRGPLLAVLALAAVSVAVIHPKRPQRFDLPMSTALPAFLVVLAAIPAMLAVPVDSPFYDQLNYHLAFPFQWLRTGTLTVFPRHAYSYFPATMGLLSTYALAALGPWAAQALHFWMGGVAVAATGVLGARLAGPRAGWWGAALLATTPAVMLSSTWAAADLAVAAFGAGAWLLVIGGRRGSPSRAVVSGVLVGLAVGCKYVAIGTVALPVLAAVLLAAPAASTTRLKYLVRLTLGALAAFAPWAVRNVVLTGNPVYPMFPELWAKLGAAVGSAPVARGIGAAGSPLLDLPGLLTLGVLAPKGEAGALGPAVLVLLPLAVIWAARNVSRGGPLLGGTIVAVVAWGAMPRLGRYLLPALVPLLALAGAGLTLVLTRWSAPLRRVVTVTVVGAVLWSLPAGTSNVELVRIEGTLGLDARNAALERWATYWPAVSYIDEQLPPSSLLLLVAESRCMYLNRDVIVEDPFQTPLLAELARYSPSADELAAELRRRGVTHILVNWAEARRMAALNHRADYFDLPVGGAAAALLDRFFAEFTRAVFSSGPVTILELRHV